MGVRIRSSNEILRYGAVYSIVLRRGLLPLNLRKDRGGSFGRDKRFKMNKFNLPRRNIQKERRQKRAERKKAKLTSAASRVSCADDSCCASTAVSLKVSTVNAHSGYLSGKKKAKLMKKWRRAQKEALQSGLVTMEDVEMMVADDEGSADQQELQPKLPKAARAFSMKKRAKLRPKSFSSKEVAPASSVAGAEGGEDAMLQ